jgi:predicted DNA-binding protein (MmcQ/YjbR family)
MSDEKRVQSDRGLEILATVRDICMRLPEVSEHVDAFGHISFRVTDKPFVMMGENEEGTSLAIKTLPTTQEFLLQQEGYFKTPYIGRHGWVSLRTTGQLDWEAIRELILEGYLRTAPKRLAKLLNQAQ